MFLFNRLKNFKIMNKFYFIIFLLIAFESKAQDPTFSQYFNNHQYLNPATAGSENGVRTSVNYRNQWPSLPGHFNSFTFSGDMGIKAAQGGAGILILDDRAGKNAMNTNGAYLNLQKLVRLVSKENRLCVAYFGFQSGFVQKRLNWNNVVFTDQLDPLLGVTQATSSASPNTIQKNYADFGVGGLLRYKSYGHYSEFGLAVTHLNRPNQSYYGTDSRLPMKWTMHYITQIPIANWGMDKESDTYISPSLMIEKQGYSEQLNLVALLHRNMLYGGLGYRFKRLNIVGQKVDAAIVHFGVMGAYDNSYHWKIGYSYDATISGIRTSTSGTHEISLTLEYDKLRLGKKGMLNKTKDCRDHNNTDKTLPVF